MARADLILNLVKAGSSGDQVHFRKAVEALAADERAKQHTVLADRILGNLSLNGNGNRKPQTPNGDPKGSSSGDFLAFFDDLISQFPAGPLADRTTALAWGLTSQGHDLANLLWGDPGGSPRTGRIPQPFF